MKSIYRDYCENCVVMPFNIDRQEHYGERLKKSTNNEFNLLLEQINYSCKKDDWKILLAVDVEN